MRPCACRSVLIPAMYPRWHFYDPGILHRDGHVPPSGPRDRTRAAACVEVLPVGRPQRRHPGAAGRAPGCTVASAAAWAFRRSHSPHRAGGAESTPSRTSSRESHAGVQRFNAAWRCRQPAQGLMPTALVALATASPMPGRAGPGGVHVPLLRFGRSAMTRLKSATSTSFMLPSGIFHQN